MISKEDAIAKFKEIIGTKSSWGQLGKSQFIEHLAIFQSWALRQALWMVERSFQEFFRSTAVNKSSLLAHVEDENYIPIKAVPSSGYCNITNNGAAAVFLDINQEFMSSTQKYYIINSSVSIASGSNAQVEFKQLKKETLEFTVEEEKAFYEILFDSEQSRKINSITVYVDTGRGPEKWKLNAKFQNAYSSSKIYDEFYAHTDQLGIRFGNGIFGAIPSLGSTVTVELWITDGDTYLAENQALSVIGEILDLAGDSVDLTVKTVGAIAGGKAMESSESIRRNLQYWPVYNDQLVWDEDYIYFIRRRFQEVVWINVWGEKEAEAQAGAASFDFVNTIFVSAYASGGADISVDVIAALDDAAKKLNRRFQWVDPKPVQFTLAVTGKVAKRRNLIEVETAIRNLLEANYGADSVDRKDTVLLKEIYTSIDSIGCFDGIGEYFEVTSTGQVTADLLEEMLQIDLENSTITVKYL